MSNELATKDDLKEMYNRIYPYLGGMPEMVANKFSKGDLYSTEEKMIGQWKDGKPLYQITVEYDASSMIFDGQTVNQLPIIRDVSIDTVVEFRGIFGREDGGTRDFFNTPSTRIDNIIYQTQINIGLNPNTVYFLSRNSTTKKLWITLQYTKTTDSAISIGNNTDYSTEEKIVGTWIDGKPLYQKTLTGSYGQNTNFDLNITNADKVIIKRAGIILSTGEYIPHGAYTNVDNFLSFFITSDKARCGVRSSPSYYNSTYYVTIQYTKTT